MVQIGDQAVKEPPGCCPQATIVVEMFNEEAVNSDIPMSSVITEDHAHLNPFLPAVAGVDPLYNYSDGFGVLDPKELYNSVEVPVPVNQQTDNYWTTALPADNSAMAYDVNGPLNYIADLTDNNFGNVQVYNLSSAESSHQIECNTEYQTQARNKEDMTGLIHLKSPRVRCDSAGSTATIGSSSSDETFNSSYTDTVSSADGLLKSSNSKDVTLKNTKVDVREIYYNDGYSSLHGTDCSSEDSLDKLHSYTRIEDAVTEESEQPLLENDAEYTKIEIEKNNEDVCDDELLNIKEFVHHQLISIGENEVVSFIQEIEPTQYTGITSNITIVDESFLFQSQLSLSEAEGAKHEKRAPTMQNLHERSSFLDLTEISKVGKACQKALIYLKDDMNFGSLASINKIVSKDIDKDAMQSVNLIDGDKGIDIIPSKRHTRNVVALSLCITLVYIAIGSVKNLQSSINHEGGVGVISMAVGYVGYMLASIFSVSIVQNFQPRLCLIATLIPNLLYVAANIYPTMWLMVPVSFVQGVSMAVMWNSLSTYITFLSRGRAQKKNESFEQVSGKYFGIFCLMYQSYLIFGNLIASLVLMYGSSAVPSAVMVNGTNATSTNISFHQSENAAEIFYEDPAMELLPMGIPFSPVLESSNLTEADAANKPGLCGTNFCPHTDISGGGFMVSNETKYMLYGIYMGCIVLSLLIAVFMLEPLNSRLFNSTVSPVQKIKLQLLSLVRFSINKKFLILTPLFMYSTMQFGFVSAEVTKAFITCPLGIHMVGYTMMCFGLCGSLSSYFCGLLCRFTGHAPLLLTASMKTLDHLRTLMSEYQHIPLSV